MPPFPSRAAALVLALSLASCAGSAPTPALPARVQPAEPGAVDQRTDAVAVGRWIAVEVRGDAEASEDLRRGRLEKVLVVNPGGHVILRGVDRVRGGGAASSFSGHLSGDAVTFADLPGVARLALDGRRLVMTDPAGRQTHFIRAAE